MTFKVGDKVVNSVFGRGEIVYGPYDTPGGCGYFFKGDDGHHRTVSGSLLTPAATFAVGDKVKGRYSGATYTIEAGPFRDGDYEWYATKEEDGRVGHNGADSLTAVEPEAADEPVKVGDVVRILEDYAYHADVKAGDLFEVKSACTDDFWDEFRIKVNAGPGARMSEWTFRPQDFEKVPADTVAVHDGVVYDLSARYRDQDGDYWALRRNPEDSSVVQAQCTPTVPYGWCGFTLPEAIEKYGPLTRV
ncbi:phiSA1p31-related protein [Streptomyces sp. bgisy159]|uniref:phiSA1p31-related protein n=1 Tax=Streptomyces sp. bgisy159 TaxID=3413795 RepID=UPI003F4A4D5B